MGRKRREYIDQLISLCERTTSGKPDVEVNGSRPVLCERLSNLVDSVVANQFVPTPTIELCVSMLYLGFAIGTFNRSPFPSGCTIEDWNRAVEAVRRAREKEATDLGGEG